VNGVRHMQEVVDAVRRCAETGMTTAQAGAQLGMTRNAVIGLAHRKGINFERGRWNHRPAKPKPQRTARTPFRKSHLKLPEESPTIEPDDKVIEAKPKRRPSPRCGWSGCAASIEPGLMFCDEHRRKPLFGRVVTCA